MKIVINRCFGGFGLSPLGLKRWAELKGRTPYFFKQEGLRGKHIPVAPEDIGRSLFFNCYDVPNPDEILSSDEGWASLSGEERKSLNAIYRSHSIYHGDIERTDAELIRVVEEMGDEASGACAKLSVVEIPDGIQYEIDEYDGLESIHETHRSWS